MMYIKIFVLAISLCQISACSCVTSTKKKTMDDNKSKEISGVKENQTWEILVSGRQCSISNPRQVLIKNQAEFDRLWNETYYGKELMMGEKPVVDFGKKWVLGIYLGMVNSGGHSVGVEKINNDISRTTIIIKHLKPGAGCVSTMAIEYPYILVAVGHLSPAEVEYKIIVEEEKCE